MRQVPKGTHNWGRWGADDERGALNHLTPDVVREAAASIRTGQVYQLGIPIQQQDVPLIPTRGTPMRLTLRDSTDEGTYPPGRDVPRGTGSHEDMFFFAAHTTSHMDALVHVYADYHHYNGVAYETMYAMSGAQKLGIEKAGGFAARAVLLDMPRYFGLSAVPHGQTITAADLEGAAEAVGVEVRAGDVVLVRTGFLEYWFASRPSDAEQYRNGQAGIGVDAAEWLASRDVAAVGSDNAAVEVMPFDKDDFLIVHKKLLVDHGIYLLEFLDLSGPARDGVAEGLLTVAPLKVTGATGCPINPILIA
ncbi:cyclase family protein [Cryptosporangium sp. NPDC048952]|uniref:cyclase family protein n=1 Tax=Cryptosporangium sp. NPDC048952 TaxID=3363961 RepID=UPI003717CFA0